MYDMKELYEAFSVEEAIELRLAHPEAQIIAGGSDVLVQMREGKRAGKELISIYLIDELRGVSLDDSLERPDALANCAVAICPRSLVCPFEYVA